MDINDFKAYFEIECRVISPDVTYLHIIAEPLFTPSKFEAIRDAARKIPGYKNTCQIGGGFSILVSINCSEFDQVEIEENIVSFLGELNANVTTIGKVIIDDCKMIEEEEKAEQELMEILASQQESGTSELDSMVGLDKLDLNYKAHVNDIYGECFMFSVCFPQGAGEAELQAVRDVMGNYDFGLEEDDYEGYTAIYLENEKVMIDLDLGNVATQNEDKVLHGILLALNGIKDLDGKNISQVVINEF